MKVRHIFVFFFLRAISNKSLKDEKLWKIPDESGQDQIEERNIKDRPGFLKKKKIPFNLFFTKAVLRKLHVIEASSKNAID